MIHVARSFLILIGIALIPVWKLWILGGWVADKIGQRRSYSHLKGDRGTEAN